MNLVTYYILPLTKLNFKSFGRIGENWNLKTTKINLEEKKIYVYVYKIEAVPLDALSNNNFEKIIKPDKIIFKIPRSIDKTLNYFVKGQYSRFPETIKSWLIYHSGLPKTHDYIIALAKDKRLRERIEKELGVILPKEAELAEAPKQEWFIKEEERV